MEAKELKAFIRDVPDFPKPGIIFKDITTLLAHPKAFQCAIDMLEHEIIYYVRNNVVEEDFDMFVAAESRGFLFAAPLADRMSKGLTILRKPGKLPYITHKYEYDLEYGKSEMHIHVDAVAGSRVIIVDDLLATGGSAEACCKLVEKADGYVVGCLFLIELEELGGRERLEALDYPVYSILRY